MKWVDLTSVDQLEDIDQESLQSPGVLIFKHSTRCAISSMALRRMKAGEAELRDDLPVYYLNLIAHRNISNQVAERYQVEHQSPQALLIRNKSCVFDTSHNGISVDAIQEAING